MDVFRAEAGDLNEEVAQRTGEREWQFYFFVISEGLCYTIVASQCCIDENDRGFSVDSMFD